MLYMCGGFKWEYIIEPHLIDSELDCIFNGDPVIGRLLFWSLRGDDR